MWKILTFLLFTLCLSVQGDFPDDPKPCKYGDSECIKTIINYLLKEKNQGDESFNLHQLNPLKVESVRIQQGGNSPVNLDLHLKNCDIFGFETTTAEKVKGFGKDLTKKNNLLLHFDYLSVVGDYDVNGKILILPIKGSGQTNITMYDAHLVLSFIGKPHQKDDGIYMDIEDFDLKIVDPKKMIFKVDNLFNGDKALGDNMNLFLNENWKEIFDEINESLSSAYSGVVANIIKTVFSKYPYDKYFTE